MTPISEAELDRPICAACGAQFEGPDTPKRCHICDDPRQYVPPSGQSWSTLRKIQEKHHNVIEEVSETNGKLYTITVEPKFPIGQRAFLIRTPEGNVLWDLVALIDDETVRKVQELGGLKAIVISHPHYYTTFASWSYAFGNIPVYIASDDERWISRRDKAASAILKLISSSTQEVISDSGITAIKAGGHFPGSMVLHWQNRLFTADTIYVVPSRLYDIDRRPGTTAFSFMWSYPNQIPLPPDAISSVVKAILPFEFEMAHGAFPGQDVKRGAKRKIVESAEILKRILTGIQPGEDTAREFWK